MSMAGRVLRARSIEPFERSRPWFAADAGTMQIQLWEGAVPSCAGTVRERTAAGTEREESISFSESGQTRPADHYG
jgi:hypothetical protein